MIFVVFIRYSSFGLNTPNQ